MKDNIFYLTAICQSGIFACLHSFIMHKTMLLSLLTVYITTVFAQSNVMQFKKRKQVINSYWNGSTIAFQDQNRQWQKGQISGIQNDSFYIRPYIVQYHVTMMDTIYYPVIGFAISDVYSLPKEGTLIDFQDGQYKVSTSGGHVHFYWIKSGWIFRAGAIGYAALYGLNGAIQNDLSFSDSKEELGIAAAIFIGGIILKKVVQTLSPHRLQISS